MRQRDAGLGVAPHAVIVRAAMGEAVGHGDGVALERRARSGGRIQQARNAAHRFVQAPKRPAAVDT